MKKSRWALLPLALGSSALLAACDQSDEGQPVYADSNIDCAALISAYSFLVTDGMIAGRDNLGIDPLFSMMMYLNSHAVPADLEETEAFALLETRREALMADLAPGAIADRAMACLANTPEG